MEPVAHPASPFLNLSAASQNICPQMKTKSSSWICLRKAFFGCCYGPGLSELFQSSDTSSAQQSFSSWAAKPDHDNARKGVRGQSDGRIFRKGHRRVREAVVSLLGRKSWWLLFVGLERMEALQGKRQSTCFPLLLFCRFGNCWRKNNYPLCQQHCATEDTHAMQMPATWTCEVERIQPLAWHAMDRSGGALSAWLESPFSSSDSSQSQVATQGQTQHSWLLQESSVRVCKAANPGPCRATKATWRRDTLESKPCCQLP